MTARLLPPAQYIDTDDGLRELVDVLSRESLLGIDTESNSLYAYREQICLFQISTREHDYIVDPFAIADMTPLGALLADPTIEKVFHAAEYDIMCLKRDYGFEVRHLFDTMIAARVLGYEAIGLGSLLEQHFDVTVDKRHQRDNWGKRPLPQDSLRYAQVDTHYLPQLYDIIRAELEANQQLVEAREIFEDVLCVPAANNEFDPEGYWRIAIPRQLAPRQVAILRELYLLRENLAERRDCPPFKIFGDQVMVTLSQRLPRNKRQLAKIKGISHGQIGRYGSQILRAIRRGLKAHPPSPPPPQPPAAPDVVERYMALHDWRKDRARKRGVESDVVLAKSTLWRLAEEAPATLDEIAVVQGIGPWRLEHYGEEILRILKRHAS